MIFVDIRSQITLLYGNVPHSTKMLETRGKIMHLLKKISIILPWICVTANAASPIICKSDDTSHAITSIWPSIYLSKSGALCFDVKNWPEYSGTNCVGNGKSAQWTGLVIVTEDGESHGRDLTNFRVRNPVVNDEQIKYTIEWSRGEAWRPMQEVMINRITGGAVSYFVTMHGGESYQCTLGKKAI